MRIVNNYGTSTRQAQPGKRRTKEKCLLTIYREARRKAKETAKRK